MRYPQIRLNRIFALLSCVSFFCAGAGGAEDTDLLTFMNKDSLHGRLVSASPDEYGIRWKHENVKNNIDFALLGVSRIKLSKRRAVERTAFDATVELTNDDVLTGNIVSLNDQALVLDTWYAGKMSIKRLMIRQINPNAGGGGLIYEGPASLANWQTRDYNDGHGQRPAWKFKNNALYATYSYPVARTVNDMPALAMIRFKAAWRGYPSFYFAFFSDNLQQYYGSNCYLLQVSSSSIYLQRYTRNSGSSSLGSVNFQRFSNQPPSQAVFTVLVDKNKRTIALLVDGEMVKQWTDGDVFAGTGNAILFQPQSRGNLKISDIKVSEWDGEIPSKTGTGRELKQDLLRFTNNDKVSGSLSAIADGNVQFKTTYATLTVPLKRVDQIVMSTENAERARRNRNDVRADFRERGAITLQMTKLGEDKITGNSENFGTVTLPIEAFRSLEFNVYEDKQEEDDGFDF